MNKLNLILNEAFYNRANIAKTYAQQNKLFAIIESFQRYIPSDKSIIPNKGR
jgi:hypothetical protein